MDFSNTLPKYFQSLEIQFLLNLLPVYNINILDREKYGGGNEKVKEYNKQFVDTTGTYTFTINESKLSNGIHLSVLSTDRHDCVTVFINTDDEVKQIAVLHNMSYYNNCAKEGLQKPGGGSLLMRFILNHLISNKEKYNIKKIVLSDHSFLPCNDDDKYRIKLSRLRMITHGQTWYMKFQFVPYNAETGLPDNKASQMIDYNRNKINKMIIKDIPVLELAVKEKGYNRGEIERLMNKYISLKDFMIRLSQEWPKFCKLIWHIMEYLYEADVGKQPILIDLFGKQYYLKMI